MTRLDKTVRMAARLSLVAILALAAGFVYFVAQIPGEPDPDAVRADGIVVLTGGPSRIADAVRLLDEGRARRLLITGVHPSTSREALNRQMPDYDRLFDCCIDIGHSAQNTAGNAAEALAWARVYGFASLIVVTSNYHLPRSLAEFSRAMPGVALQPYPVVSDNFRENRWLSDTEALRLVMMEYVKYLASLARGALTTARPAGAAIHAANPVVPEATRD